jgi:hypothetical protein
MQRWLASFFTANASRLTSTRLQQARVARAEAKRAAAAVTFPGPEKAPAAGVVQAPEGVHNCGAECLRGVAEDVLLEQEQFGRPQKLQWQPFLEDRQRWAPLAPDTSFFRRGARPAPDACQLREPDETISRDFLVITAVGNNWATVNGWVCAGRWSAVHQKGKQEWETPIVLN